VTWSTDQLRWQLCVRLLTKHGLGSTRQAISQHLDVLEAAGLVVTRREGRYKFHDLDPTPLRQISERWGSEAKGGSNADHGHERPGR
jgi:DNA-binding transcriptional ArsR family regulator